MAGVGNHRGWWSRPLPHGYLSKLEVPEIERRFVENHCHCEAKALADSLDSLSKTPSAKYMNVT